MTDRTAEEQQDPQPSSEPLSVKGGLGAAMGAAMLGLEQALRDEPPAQVLAAEHVPDRRQVGAEGDLVIELPDLPDDLPAE